MRKSLPPHPDENKRTENERGNVHAYYFFRDIEKLYSIIFRLCFSEAKKWGILAENYTVRTQFLTTYVFENVHSSNHVLSSCLIITYKNNYLCMYVRYNCHEHG